MNDLNTYYIYALSNRSAVIDLGNTINESLNDKVLAMHGWLNYHPFTGLKDIVISYSSLAVMYDPFLIYTHQKPTPGSTIFDFVKAKLEEAWIKAEAAVNIHAKLISIPVCYHPDLGHDIKLVAAAKKMDIDELISIHCAG